MALSLFDWVMLVSGAAILCAGFAVLHRARFSVPADDWTQAQQAARGHTPNPRRWSMPSLFVLGLGLLAQGYHLVVWALPIATGIYVNRQSWWVVTLAGTILVLVSRAIDLAERRGRDEDAS